MKIISKISLLKHSQKIPEKFQSSGIF